MTYTMIAVVRIGNGNPPLVHADLTWPLGEHERHTLNHDWAADSWHWRGGQVPDSLDRLLTRDKDLTIEAVRRVYVSPGDVGVASNEEGRLMIYEVDYEA